MSVKATKTHEEYLDEQLKKGKKTVEDEIAKGREEDAALKEKTHSILDQSAKSAAAVYEQDIAQAPLDSRVQYDRNAMDEAVNRKKITETLANMGMTDSGISSSMNTALTVQKSNADHSVRVAEQQRIRAAESAIDQIWADNETKKAQQDLSIDTAADQRERTLRQNMETQAAANATELYNQDLQSQTDAYVAEQKAAADIYAAKLKGEQDVTNNRAAMAQKYIMDGVKPDEAWTQAYAAYPASTVEGVKYAYRKSLRESGYARDYANAMSDAYASAVADEMTESNAISAAMEATQTVATEEIRKAGLTATQQNLSLVAFSLEEAIKMATEFKSMFQQVAEQKGTPLSETALAYTVGRLYATIVTDDNVNRVGQELSRQFGGSALKVALYWAGLE